MKRARFVAGAVLMCVVPVAAAAQAIPEIPHPQLDTLEPAVVDQLREVQRELEAASASPAVRGRKLGDAYGSLARVYHAYEFFDAAEASYLNALRVAPSDARWLHLLAYLYQQTGRPEEAASRYIAALRSDPGDRPAHVHLGEVYLELNRPRDAREQFQKVVTTFPGVARNGLGEAALREGRFEEAIPHLRSALDRLPEATSIHYSLAMAYRGLGRLDEARAHLLQRGSGGVRAVDPIADELLTLRRGERALVIQGARAYEAGQFQDAAKAFEQALAANPSSVTAHVNLGLAQSRLGKAGDAAAHFEAALRLDRGNVTAHASLGMLLAQQRRDPDAVIHLRAAFEASPGDANVRESLVAALLRLERESEAMAILGKARSVDPDDDGVIVSLSILLAHQERYREAVELLADANRRLPDRPAMMTTLARLLASSPDLSLRDGRRALDLAMAVYESSPTPVDGETVALALAELGRCEEALAWMRRSVEGAERAKDAAEAARLRNEVSKYDRPSCRPAAGQ